MSKTKKLNLVEKTILNLKNSEESNARLTFDHIEKDWAKNKKLAERNIERLKRNLEEDVEEKRMYLEEAKDQLTSAYTLVNSEVDSHSKRVEFMKTYEAGLADAINKVASIEDTIESMEEVAKEAVKKQQKIVDLMTKHIAALNQEFTVEVED